jgi:hypothetical protein
MAPRVLATPRDPAHRESEVTVDTRSIRLPGEEVTAKQRSPKRYVCDGCGERFPLRELIELHEDNHDNLTYFDGQLLCRRCADAAGAAY